jgi:hypothetical protein
MMMKDTAWSKGAKRRTEVVVAAAVVADAPTVVSRVVVGSIVVVEAYEIQ